MVTREAKPAIVRGLLLVYDASGALLRPLQLDHEAHRIALTNNSLCALERAVQAGVRIGF